MQEMQELKEIIENGRINLLPAERVAENILAAGYRKTFTSDLASDTQKAYKEGYEKARKETAKEILNDLYFNLQSSVEGQKWTDAIDLIVYAAQQRIIGDFVCDKEELKEKQK